MGKSPSPLWRHGAVRALDGLASAIDSGLSARETEETATVFFRADDIGVPGRQFERLMALFLRYRVPLGLAVVPAWLTAPRWRSLAALGAAAPELWCWHHHGWRHVNHETTGKKQEFGAGRPADAILGDLSRGKARLAGLMGEAFYPLFTPPWNRMCAEAMAALASLDYRALSRSQGARPESPPDLPDIPVNVDLHTRKEEDPEVSGEKLLGELTAGLADGPCGIMIHHQVMNDAAFDFLESLLAELTCRRGLALVGMAALAESRRRATGQP